MATRYGEVIDMISCLAISNGAKPKGERKTYDKTNFGDQGGATAWPLT